MPTSLVQIRNELARANRILAHEGVLDGFGHVSVRHPDDPNRYLLSRSRSPELIQASDILEFTLDSAAGPPADGGPLCRARDPRLHLPGAARRERGGPPSCARRHAVLHRRR